MIQTLQSLRFVFIMLIVLSHIIGKRFDFGGECGVSFFFMLSGFVLSLAYGKQVDEGRFSTLRLVLRQLLKFYPLHLLMLVVFVVLDARIGHLYDWQHLLPNILLLQSWIPLDEYYFVANGSSWFLCDMLFFYLVFCFFYRILNQLGTSRLLLAGTALLACYLLLAYSIPLASVNSILYASPATRLIDFCMGIMLCRLYRSDAGKRMEKMLERSSTATITCSEILLIALLVASFLVYENLSLRLRCAALFWFVIPPILLFFASSDKHQGLVTRLLLHPALVWCGGLTLEIYLTHMLVFRVVNSVMLSMGISYTWLMALVGLAFLVPIAWLTKSFFVDKIYVSLRKYVL